MARRLILFAGLALCAGGASAQGITGTWNATVETGQGPFMLAFELVAEGSELMGSMINDFMGQVPIYEGKVEGSMVSFKLAFEAAPGASMVVNFAGELAGDELKLTSTFETEAPPGTQAEQSFVATRAEAQQTLE